MKRNLGIRIIVIFLSFCICSMIQPAAAEILTEQEAYGLEDHEVYNLDDISLSVKDEKVHIQSSTLKAGTTLMIAGYGIHGEMNCLDVCIWGNTDSIVSEIILSKEVSYVKAYFVGNNHAPLREACALLWINAPTDCIYVSKVQTKIVTDEDQTDAADEVTAQAEIIKADGTKAIINLAITEETAENESKYYVSLPAANGSVSKTEVHNYAADVGTSFAYSVKDGVYTLEAVNLPHAADTFVNDAHGLVKSSTMDDFGRPTTTWISLQDRNLKVVIPEQAVLTYTTAVSPSKLYRALGLTEDTMAAVFVDGVASTTILSKSNTDKTIGGNGVATEVYLSSDGDVTIVNVTDILSRVIKIVKAKAATETAAATEAYIMLDDHRTYETDAFAKGDRVIINSAAGDIKSVAKAKTVKGIYSGYKGSTIRINSTSYTLSQNSTVFPPSLSPVDTYIFYLDSYGNVVDALLKPKPISTDYVYIEKYQSKLGTDADLFNPAGKNAAVASAIFTDGTAETINLAVSEKDGVPYTDVPAADGTVSRSELTTKAVTNIGNWFAYTVKDGVYTLEEINGTYASVERDVVLPEKSTAVIAGRYICSETIVTAFDTNNMKTSFTGLAEKKTVLTGNVLVTYAKNSEVISAIYAVEQPVAAAEDVAYAYAVERGFTSADGKTVEWIFAIDGVQVTCVLESHQIVTVGNVYMLSDKNSDNVWTVTQAAGVMAGEISVLDSTFLVADGRIYTLADKYAVYNVSENAAITGAKDTLAEGDTLYVFLNKNGEISVAYIIAEAE